MWTNQKNLKPKLLEEKRILRQLGDLSSSNTLIFPRKHGRALFGDKTLESVHWSLLYFPATKPNPTKAMAPPFPHLLQLLPSPWGSLLPQWQAGGWPAEAGGGEGWRRCSCSQSFPLLLHISPTLSQGEIWEGSSPLAGVWGELSGGQNVAFLSSTKHHNVQWMCPTAIHQSVVLSLKVQTDKKYNSSMLTQSLPNIYSRKAICVSYTHLFCWLPYTLWIFVICPQNESHIFLSFWFSFLEYVHDR